jgi:hypothetical protein
MFCFGEARLKIVPLCNVAVARSLRFLKAFTPLRVMKYTGSIGPGFAAVSQQAKPGIGAAIRS